MDYEIIFYHAGKTAEIQALIDSSLNGISLHLRNVCAAVSPVELSKQLAVSVSRSRLIVVIGGDDECETVLGKVLTTKSGSISQETIESYGVRAVVRTVSGQAVVQLPGDTEDISCILDGLVQRLAEYFGTKPETDKKMPAEAAIKELDEKMASINRIKVNVSGSTAEKRTGSRLKKLKITIAVLLLLAAAQLGAASYLFITQM